MSLQAQASQLWAMLDELSAGDPAGYRSFIERQMADGQRMLTPPSPLFCAARPVRVASAHLLARLLADADSSDDDGDGESAMVGGGDSEQQVLSGFMSGLKVVDADPAATTSRTPPVTFPAGFAPARLVAVFVSWSRVNSSDLSDPSAQISAHVGRPFPSRQLPDALLLPVAFHPDTLAQALPGLLPAAAAAGQPSSPSPASIAARPPACLLGGHEGRGFVAHTLDHCLAQRLRGCLAPADDADAAGFELTPVSADEPAFEASLRRALGYRPGDAALQRMMQTRQQPPTVAQPPQPPQLHQPQPQSQQQLELTTSLNRVERLLTVRVAVGCVADSADDLDVRVEPRLLTLRRAADVLDGDVVAEEAALPPPLVRAPLPCEVAPDEASARFLRGKRVLLLRLPVVGPLPPA